MGPLKNVVDIISKLGGIETLEQAIPVFDKKLDKSNLEKLNLIKTSEALIKIANAAIVCQPDSIFINTASEEDRKVIREHRHRRCIQ